MIISKNKVKNNKYKQRYTKYRVIFVYIYISGHTVYIYLLLK